MIDYPVSTLVGKPVPKNAFYKHLELNTRLRTRFVEDVEKIVWAAKYTPSTLRPGAEQYLLLYTVLM